MLLIHYSVKTKKQKHYSICHKMSHIAIHFSIHTTAFSVNFTARRRTQSHKPTTWV